jgi:hypothetical protein
VEQKKEKLHIFLICTTDVTGDAHEYESLEKMMGEPPKLPG